MNPTEQHENLDNLEVENPSPSRRTLAEWVTFSIATCILVALISLVLYDWLIVQTNPPVLKVESYGAVRVVQGQYYQPFAITNRGGDIAQSVQVVAELRTPGESDEQGEQEIDFLAGGEQKRGNFVFSHNPGEGELVLRVASYKLP